MATSLSKLKELDEDGWKTLRAIASLAKMNYPITVELRADAGRLQLLGLLEDIRGEPRVPDDVKFAAFALGKPL